MNAVKQFGYIIVDKAFVHLPHEAWRTNTIMDGIFGDACLEYMLVPKDFFFSSNYKKVILVVFETLQWNFLSINNTTKILCVHISSQG